MGDALLLAYHEWPIGSIQEKSPFKRAAEGGEEGLFKECARLGA